MSNYYVVLDGSVYRLADQQAMSDAFAQLGRSDLTGTLHLHIVARRDERVTLNVALANVTSWAVFSSEEDQLLVV